METDKTQDEINRVIISRKMNCPVCGTEFKSWDVSSYKVRIVKTDTDLRNYFSPYDPLYYAVVLCPDCGYGALRSSFSKITAKQAPLILENIKDNLPPKEYPQVYSVGNAIERCMKALKCADILSAKNSEKGLLCLHLSWLFRDKGDEVAEGVCRDNALKCFLHAYEHERFPIAGMDPPTLQYLIGDLYRRSGQLTEAHKYIGNVVVAQGIPARLKQRALDVKELISNAKQETLDAGQPVSL